MMMQMLHAGGIPVLVDDLRLADQHNENGYWEYAPVKNTLRDSSWADEAHGKAVKVVAPLLHGIPLKYKCKVIFMERDLDQLLYSQQKMLASIRGEQDVAIPIHRKNSLKDQLRKARARVHNRTNIDVLYLNYESVQNAPEEVAKKVASFLNYPVDVFAMKKVVNPRPNPALVQQTKES